MTCNWYNLIVQKELSEFIIPKNFYNELEKTLQKNINVGYIHLQTNTFDESSWVPLLPGYVVYTSLGGYFFKLSIIKEGECLQFFWQEFGKDSTFTNCNAQGRETLGFYLMIKNYNIKNISLASILGFNEPTIVAILQNTVHNVFSHRFFIKIQLFNL